MPFYSPRRKIGRASCRAMVPLPEVAASKLGQFLESGLVLFGSRAAMLGLPLDRETTAPPLGDGPLRVTVPVEDCVPPVTLVGFSVSDDRVAVGGVTVSDAVLLAPP